MQINNGIHCGLLHIRQCVNYSLDPHNSAVSHQNYSLSMKEETKAQQDKEFAQGCLAGKWHQQALHMGLLCQSPYS